MLNQLTSSSDLVHDIAPLLLIASSQDILDTYSPARKQPVHVLAIWSLTLDPTLLSTMGKQRELAAHIRGALNNGLTEVELRYDMCFLV